MKNYPQFILDKLNQDSVAIFIVIEILLSNPKRWTTLPYDVEINGENYTGKGALITFDLPRSDQAVSRESYKLAVSDPGRLLEAELTQEGTGAPLNLYVGFFDGTQPNLEHIAVLYKGSIDTYAFRQEESARLLSIQGVSPAGALSYGRAIFTDKNYVTQYDANDRSMDLVGTTSLDNLILGWGKKPSASNSPIASFPLPFPPDWQNADGSL
jgi:hypothetical protein